MNTMVALTEACERGGVADLAERIAALQADLAGDLAGLSGELADLPGDTLVHVCARHLLERGGKHLRAMCVALAARAGVGSSPAARDLAIAVELVHAATLLHDDVVDVGETRRGAPAARVLYGNAASIFAGDWLLVEALRRIRRARVPGLLDAMLDAIERMIEAEALQLAARGRLAADRATYFAVVDGKTATLFRWAMQAGARAGGLPAATCRALEEYGRHLGVAFQIVDDLLDYTGDAARTGKTPLADLREGKITYPLLLALERDRGLRRLLEELAATPGEPPAEARARVVAALEATGSLVDSRALARARAAEAVGCLAALPDEPARRALVTVAEAAVQREA